VTSTTKTFAALIFGKMVSAIIAEPAHPSCLGPPPAVPPRRPQFQLWLGLRPCE
jgi:hypothetical protein